MTTLETPPTACTVSAPKATSAGGGSNLQTNVEHLTIPQVLKQLGVDPKAGLSSAEAQKRLGQYGPNALEEKKKSELAVFLGFFWGPIPWMIEAAALMSLLGVDPTVVSPAAISIYNKAEEHLAGARSPTWSLRLALLV